MPVKDLEPTEFQKKHHSKLQIEVDRRTRRSVLEGIELLKKVHGEDWVDRIDLDSLDLMNGDRCVLGQLYGNYERGCKELSIESKDGLYGFSFRGLRDEDDERPHDWAMLNAAWFQELAEEMGLFTR